MKFITTAPDRRTLVKAIAEHTGIEPSYIGPPTFNYTVGTITIDREGSVDVPDEQAADLKAFLIAKGWMEPEPEPEQPRIQIGVPAKDLTVANVTNLIYMRYLQYSQTTSRLQFFSTDLWNATIDRMTVNLDGSVKMAFRNGIEIMF